MGSILLVEPDRDSNEAWTSELHAAGHVVLVAATMRAALALLRDGGIDVVVIDTYGECIGVLGLARDIEALPDAPPVVLVSASPVAPEISARIGAAAFLPKPCEPNELLVAVTRLFAAPRPVRFVDDEPTGLHPLNDKPTGRTQLG